ncbi:hypothetical protein ACFFNY_33140 [Paenibacillus hodogayensis]|uniref:Rpn family recombination-promoting nuclease/putative transposase n=1 Tax=Paenibacillus hodogayensis TaxID=279208 RepID=A0ABV5W783_9BACL
MDPIIAKTEERLEWLSSDEETIRLYEAREHSLIERNSLIAEGEARGEAKGEAKGEARGIAKAARAMLIEGIDMTVIAKVTGLSVAEIERLAEEKEHLSTDSSGT